MQVGTSQHGTEEVAGYPFLKEFSERSSPGDRLVAVVMLQWRPDPDYIEWLGARVSEARAFIGNQAAFALLAAARVLNKSYHSAIHEAIAAAKRALGTGEGTQGRLGTLEKAEKELAEDAASYDN